MIQKMSSKDIMDLLEESQNSIKDIELNVNDIKSELEKRLSIIKNVQEYTQESIIDIKELLSNGFSDNVENIILLSQQEATEGLYDKYGSVIHPAFIKTPTNVFNFGTISGKIFKNNANVKINDAIKLEYTNIMNFNKEYELYFNDHAFFRKELLITKLMLDFKVFKSMINEYWLLGKYEWIFLHTHGNIIYDFIGTYLFTEQELENAKNTLIEFRNKLKSKNIDFVLMVCPEKNVVYPEYMPSYIKRKSIKNSTDQFVEYMKKNTDINIVYPKNILLNYKKEYELYYKFSDFTHWNNVGGYVGFQELMKSIDLEVPPLENKRLIITGVTNNFFYPFAKMQENIYTITNYPNDNKKELFAKNILLIHDSYMEYMKSYFYNYFYTNKVFFKHTFSDGYTTNKNVDILIYETVERQLKNQLIRIKYFDVEKLNSTN